MAKTRVFVSFDYDNNLDLKNLLVGQARNPDSPFDVIDNSLKETQPEADWLATAKRAISRSEVVVVLLGSKTHSASGVRKEVKVANDLSKMGFSITRVRELLGDRAAELVDPWLARIRPLVVLVRDAQAAGTLVEEQTVGFATALDPEKQRAAFTGNCPNQTTFDACRGPAYSLWHPRPLGYS